MAGDSMLRGVFLGVVVETLMAYSPFVLVGVAVAWFFIPAPIKDRVVLLPDPDGKVGAVIVTSKAGEQTLNTAYAGVGVNTNGKIVPGEVSGDELKKRFGAVLEARPPRPVSFTVYFASGSATQLDFVSRSAIGAMKAELAGRPAPEITVIGHTDSVGELEANDALSRERAAAVREMLIEAGVPAASIDVAGRGEREPVIKTPDDTDEPLNRRVEISVR